MSMLINKNMTKRIYKIPVGHISDDKVEETLKDVMDRFKRPLVNPLTGEIYLSDFDITKFSQDVWFPSPKYDE